MDETINRAEVIFKSDEIDSVKMGWFINQGHSNTKLYIAAYSVPSYSNLIPEKVNLFEGIRVHYYHSNSYLEGGVLDLLLRKQRLQISETRTRAIPNQLLSRISLSEYSNNNMENYRSDVIKLRQKISSLIDLEYDILIILDNQMMVLSSIVDVIQKRNLPYKNIHLIGCNMEHSQSLDRL